MVLIRSVIFLLLWFVWTAVLGIIASPFLLLRKGHPIILSVTRIWALFTLFLLRVVCSISHEVIGIENLENEAFLIASKHQSAWETIFFLCFFKNPVLVIKKELTKIPIYGWYLYKSSMIVIDRNGGMKTMKTMMQAAKDSISMRRSVIIFPEGTRTSPGERIKYKSGIKFLSDQLGINVLPIALNSGKYWINKSIIRKPGVVKVKILPQIKNDDTFLQNLQNIIDGESEAL
jgi:1-acyl-sn-glycerol-3-phosphate acyltransferase